MPALLPRVQPWSDQGEKCGCEENVSAMWKRQLTSVLLERRVRKHRNCLGKTLRMVQQVQGQKGFEAWNLIVRRCCQRNKSDKIQAYTALNSNISDRGRAQGEEQFDDNSEDVHEQGQQGQQGRRQVRQDQR